MTRHPDIHDQSLLPMKRLNPFRRRLKDDPCLRATLLKVSSPGNFALLSFPALDLVDEPGRACALRNSPLSRPSLSCGEVPFFGRVPAGTMVGIYILPDCILMGECHEEALRRECPAPMIFLPRPSSRHEEIAQLPLGRAALAFYEELRAQRLQEISA